MSSTRTVTRTLPAWLTLLGIVLLALNLRASIAALSPLIDEVRADLDLTRGQAGLLTSLPVLCFGLLSPLAPLLGRRVGLELSLLLVMLGVVAGSLVRTAPGVAAMVAGTVLIGAAVTVGNVLVPSVVKQDFAQSDGLVTGLYTAALTGGAALSAALSAPLADGVGLGWRGSLLVWGGLALVAALVWLPQLQVRHVAGADRGSPGAVLRSPQTWWLAGFMAMQALSFYALLAWLPDLLEDEGVSAVGAGWALSLFNLLGIVSALVVPTLAGRRPDQRLLVLITCGTWLVALVGLGAAPSWWPLWSVLAGLAQGSGISLALSFLVLKARTPAVARDLSGTVQSVGYLVGSSGPLVVGWLRDVSGDWTQPLVFLCAVLVLMAVAGVAAARERQVGG